MTMRTMRNAVALGAAALMALGAAGCGGDSGGGGGEGGGPNAGALNGVDVRVGSKDFTEQLVLGELTKQTLEAAGANATYEGQQGTEAARQALESDQTDLYWDYTGTGWITFLGNERPIDDTERQYRATKREDVAENGIDWITPAPFNNTYALAIRQEKARELGVRTLSDYFRLVRERPQDATLCVESEFNSRDDGLPGLEEAYGGQVPRDNVKVLDTALVYTQTDRGEVCNFGEVFTTDGRIRSLGLQLLEDDRKFFPIYQPSVTLKQDFLRRNPRVEQVLKPLADKLTYDQILAMNVAVDSEGRTPEAVAEEFLQEQGLVGG